MAEQLFEKIINGYRVGYHEAVALAEGHDVDTLCALADRLRAHFLKDRYEACSIMNARSGLCSENCKWCSQSRHHPVGVDVYPLVDAAQAVEAARSNADRGVKRFSLVTSGRGMSERDLEKVCELYTEIRERVDICLCASMGLLTLPQMERLKASGVERYHCNLESAPSYFPHLCTTHTTEEKLNTLKAAKQAGLDICSGGIIGMGESREQRIELAVALRAAGVDSIPLNILNPIPGTPLQDMPALPDEEVLLTAALFRIINPQVHIRLAGGRVRIAHLAPKLLHSGVSAAIVGDMLTTVGSSVESDMQMFENEGFFKG